MLRGGVWAKKISVDLDDDDVAAAENPETAQLFTLASGRPSVHKAKIYDIAMPTGHSLRFPNMPKPIKGTRSRLIAEA